MTDQKKIFKRLSTLTNLPTLPQILLKLIEACNQDNPDLNAIGAMVSKDPSLSAKILKLVNSAFFGLPRKVDIISHAVVLVGTSGIKNLAICACVYDVFPKSTGTSVFNLKRFWWHSLRCAFMAKHIASTQDACPPDEAFLSGLLHDIGKVILWANFRNDYEALIDECGDNADLMLAGESRMGATHAEVGAWLLNRWKLDSSIVDCVRYHHDQSERITHAFAMVQGVHVANLLCKDSIDDVNDGLTLASRLFGLDPSQCQDLMTQSNEEAREVANSLDINIDSAAVDDSTPDEKDRKVQNRLADEVKGLSLTMGILEGFLTAEDITEIVKCMADGLKLLFDIQQAIFFLFEKKRDALVGFLPDQTGAYVKHPRFAISMQMRGSLLIGSLRQHRAMDSFASERKDSLSIIDEQIIRLLGGKGMVCMPLIVHNDPVGVLAAGIGKDDLPVLIEHTRLLRLVMHKGAAALHMENMRRREMQMVHAKRMDASIDLARRVIHEVNNPLSVIKNYIKVVEMRMADAGLEHDELRIVNEEVSRVGRLLQKLTSFSQSESPAKSTTNANTLLADILALFRHGLINKSNIDLHRDLDPDLPAVAAHPDGLKQVFINLIKNAIEAMSEKGGRLDVQTRFFSSPLGEKSTERKAGSNGHVEIVFRDSGPGIDASVQETLFDPYVSTKKGEHSGLGLSVAHNIVKSFQGALICESTTGKGTTFRIELPVS
jgi:putative nucleotidyltransferase with HDIG domain